MAREHGDMTIDEAWITASVKVSRRGKILEGVTKLLIPTCIPELVVLSLLLPSLSLVLILPFLVIPTMLGGLVLWTIFRTSKAECSASFQRGYLLVKIPGVDVLCLKPKQTLLEGGGVLRVSSRFKTLKLLFKNEWECSRMAERLK